MNYYDEINLLDDDLCAIIVINGKFHSIYSNKQKKVLKLADLIRDVMATFIKKNKYKKGLWFWYFKDAKINTNIIEFPIECFYFGKLSEYPPH